MRGQRQQQQQQQQRRTRVGPRTWLTVPPEPDDFDVDVIYLGYSLTRRTTNGRAHGDVKIRWWPDGSTTEVPF